jgi:antitoxin component YwqK of YwqJK toxin-antitoxin module
MKKIILVVACLAGAINFLYAQEPDNQVNYNKSELVALSESESTEGYFALNSSYSIDEEGRVSGKVLSFYNDGDLQETGSYLMGEKHGKWLKYSESGILVNEGNYNQGQKDGTWKVWDENGTLRLEFFYENGQRVGTWKMYNEKGEEINTQVYNQ